MLADDLHADLPVADTLGLEDAVDERRHASSSTSTRVGLVTSTRFTTAVLRRPVAARLRGRRPTSSSCSL